MALRQCEKCGETVDEAKAFCPGCGHAFVEEQKRSQASNFEAMDNTVQLGQTMYNQMLSDMGLNISKSPDAPPKRVEVVIPAVQEASPKPEKPAPELKKAPNYLKWLIIAGASVLLLAFLVIAAAALIILYSYYR